MTPLVHSLSFLLNILAMFAVILWSFLCALSVMVIVPFYRPWGFLAERAWARVSLRLLGIRVRYEGLENLHRGGGILAPNHSSLFDIFILAALPLDLVWISKKEVGYVPFLGSAMKRVGCYFVSRDRSGADLNVMKEVEDGLRQGATILIFPEGTRTRDGKLLPLRKGAFRTAMNAGVPLFPIGIQGAFEIAPPYRIPKRWGHNVIVRIGPPVRLPPETSLIEAMENFRTELLKLRSPTR